MAASAVCMQGLKAPPLLSAGNALRGKALVCKKAPTTRASPSRHLIRAATESVPGGNPRSLPAKPRSGTKFATQPLTGTKYARAKKLKVLEEGDKSARLRDKAKAEPAAIKLLSRVEQLRLLTKAERAGLLSAAENAGLTLSSIEKLGLLSKAEEFGALSAAANPKTPSLLLRAALGLLVLGPAFVYFVPEDSTPLVVIQVVVALVSVLGGSAAFAASSFVSALQSSD